MYSTVIFAALGCLLVATGGAAARAAYAAAIVTSVILRLCYNALFSTVALSRLFDCYMTKYTIMLTASPGSLS